MYLVGDEHIHVLDLLTEEMRIIKEKGFYYAYEEEENSSDEDDY